ncbi:hypothetical protein FIBSPDRAFT_850807, partial [Athelia psychrophila]
MASHQHTNALFIRPSFLSPNRYIANFKTRIIEDLSLNLPPSNILSAPHLTLHHRALHSSAPFEHRA